MGVIDIVPDIHGQPAKLRGALDVIGWRRSAAGWVHPEPHRRIVFLGDFIDRGPENGAVMRLVRDLMDAGKARAVMGNHEFNALHYHTLHPRAGHPLRPRCAKNEAQHRRFLDEFPIGATQTADALSWMRSLPLFLEEADFRAVHACWSAAAVASLRALAPDGVLTEELVVRAADPGDPLHAAAELLTKGPEHPLPAGCGFADQEGALRDHVRLQWWNAAARSWRDIAISVPEAARLPEGGLPDTALALAYGAAERPVFFGHYWLTGKPRVQGPNALCLDYSAGRDGPLVTYEFQPGAGPLSEERIRVHPLPT